MKKQFNLNDNLTITKENVKSIGEMIAISATKKFMQFSNLNLQKLYARLVHNVFDGISINENFSDGYEIASVAICFLCDYIGKQLGDFHSISSHKKRLSIRHACFNEVFAFLEREKQDYYNLQELDKQKDLELSFEEMQEILDYTRFDEILGKLNLKQSELDVLDCYLNGLGFVETAKELSINLSTVWQRRKRIQEKYLKNNQKNKILIIKDADFLLKY